MSTARDGHRPRSAGALTCRFAPDRARRAAGARSVTGTGPAALVTRAAYGAGVPDDVARPADLDVVRGSYDRAADAYVALRAGELADRPWLRAALAAFAEEVRALRPVLDVGCGPGHVTAHLAGLGVDVSGVDLSPRMVGHARRLHPGLRFSVASATDLRLDDASLGGVLGWWSLFHLPRTVLPGVLRSCARALVPGGQFLLGTHVGDGEIVRTEAYGGVPVRWTTHLWRPAALTALLEEAGLETLAQLRLPTEAVGLPQVLVAARRPG